MAKKKRRKKKDSQKNDLSIYVDDLFGAYDQSDREFSKLESIDFGFRQNSSPESINNELDKSSDQIDTKTTEQISSQENTNQESTHHNEGEKGATPSTSQEPNTPLDNGQQKPQEYTKQGESSSQESDSTPDNQPSDDKLKDKSPQQKQEQDTKQPNSHKQQSAEKDTTSEERELSPEETKTKVLQRTDEDIKRRAELRKNLDEQKAYLKKKREQFNAVQNKINKTSEKISEMEGENPNLSAAYDKNSKKISAAIEEYRKELATAAEKTRIGGTNKLNLHDSNYNEEIAKRAFKDEILAAEKTKELIDGKIEAVSHYLNKEKLVKLNKIQENLAKEISPLINKSGDFSARGAIRAKHMADITAKSGGWKGKAKIFGGIAAGALALTGVASLMMSGGRQENSNLYNPYQAMY